MLLIIYELVCHLAVLMQVLIPISSYSGCTDEWAVTKARREETNYEELSNELRKQLGVLTGYAVGIPESEG